MALVSFHDVSVRLGGHPVLEHVDLDVARGEIITIVGPNGSGKSTLLKTILGAVRPGSGKIIRAKGLRIGYVPQSLSLDRTLPMTARRFLSLPTPVRDDVSSAALEHVGAGALADRQLIELSGGQLQRVLLARAILPRPDLLLLDEPTTGLDQAGAAGFYRMLEAIRDEIGCAVVMVSHDLHVVMSASDRVICLNGHVCCVGTPDVVSAAPEYRALFGTQTHGALALYRHEHDHAHHHHDDTDA